MAVVIADVIPGSLAAKKKIAAGDRLLSMNGQEIADVLDYRFHLQNTRLLLEIQSVSGRLRKVRIKKDEETELGLQFETYLMDKQRACRNKCIFCFIDQLPPGMRSSLYFKDDDSRLSFLFGNYITLTNLTEHEIERIIHMHISPINISVHTTDPELRCRMMGNRFAGDALKTLHRFAKAGLTIQCQLVLCPGYNDGDSLQKSMEDLAELYPAVTSVAAVPVGLTRYRENLTELRPFTKEECIDTIDRIEKMGERMLRDHGTRVFYASDEWYLKAGRRLPDADRYEEFAQLENGVGMAALLRAEFREALAEVQDKPAGSRLCIATGVDAAPILQGLIDEAQKKWHNKLSVRVIPVENRFFGENITVAGLLTGQDIAAALCGVQADRLLLSENVLRQQGDCFLDDMTPAELEQTIKMPVSFIPDSGQAFVEALLM